MERVCHIKKMLTLTFVFLNFFFTLSVKADTILTCEAARLSTDLQNFNTVSYPKIFPTIIIDKENKQIRYFFSEHGQQWNYNFEIVDKIHNNILGIKNFKAGEVQIMSLNLKTMQFSNHSSLPEGTQLTFGKCFR